jgi:hypothetical protein
MNAALLLDAVGVPRDAFTQVSLIARCRAGSPTPWSSRRPSRMIRPASNYIGPKPAV